jgi:alpha-galactosidase
VKTPDFKHPSGRYKILDTTHPEVIEHLTSVMQSIREAGFKFVKIDFLFAGAFSGGRFGEVTSMQAYEKAMDLIRRTLGSSVEILACGAPHLASRAYVDRWRIGPDIAYQFPTGHPTWVDIDIQLRNMGARWFLCKGLACDSDPWLVRGRRPIQELQTSLWVASLMGQGFTFSDNFLRVSPARQELIPNRPALDQASSGTPASPDYLQWLSDVGPRLGSATAIDRIIDHQTFQAPRLWQTSQGGLVFLNFSNKSFQWGQNLVSPRQSVFKDP